MGTFVLLKGMPRRNIEHFLKKPIWEKLGIFEMKQLNFFFPFPIACIFYFCKNMNPRIYILFLVDKSVT